MKIYHLVAVLGTALTNHCCRLRSLSGPSYVWHHQPKSLAYKEKRLPNFTLVDQKLSSGTSTLSKTINDRLVIRQWLIKTVLRHDSRITIARIYMMMEATRGIRVGSHTTSNIVLRQNGISIQSWVGTSKLSNAEWSENWDKWRSSVGSDKSLDPPGLNCTFLLK